MIVANNKYTTTTNLFAGGNQFCLIILHNNTIFNLKTKTKKKR